MFYLPVIFLIDILTKSQFINHWLIDSGQNVIDSCYSFPCNLLFVF